MAAPTQELFHRLAARPWISDFYLAGGTALALQLGHRTSVDLDFFSERSVNEETLLGNLAQLGKLQVLEQSAQSITGILDAVKFSFLGYNYPMAKRGRAFEGVRIASMEDIACMKLVAISRRGAKRDFIDLYFVAKHISLRELFALFERKYAQVRYNLIQIRKSLVYFEDAEGDPMPDMLVPVNWAEVKKFFVEQVLDLR